MFCTGVEISQRLSLVGRYRICSVQSTDYQNRQIWLSDVVDFAQILYFHIGQGLFGSKELCFTQILRFHGDQICLVVTLCLHKYCTFTLLKSLWETRVMLFAQMLDFHTGHIWLVDKGCDMDKHCIFTAVRSILGDNGYVLHKY